MKSENGQTIGDDPPLVVVEVSAGVLHPELHDGPGQLLTQGRHQQEVVLSLHQALHQGTGSRDLSTSSVRHITEDL